MDDTVSYFGGERAWNSVEQSRVKGMTAGGEWTTSIVYRVLYD